MEGGERSPARPAFRKPGEAGVDAGHGDLEDLASGLDITIADVEIQDSYFGDIRGTIGQAVAAGDRVDFDVVSDPVGFLANHAAEDTWLVGVVRSLTAGLAEYSGVTTSATKPPVTVVDGTETKIPVIPKSYHKINTGSFVETPFGPRLLRQSEIEHIHRCELKTRHYSTAVQILGQGVLTRMFRRILGQVASSLVTASEERGPTEVVWRAPPEV